MPASQRKNGPPLASIFVYGLLGAFVGYLAGVTSITYWDVSGASIGPSSYKTMQVSVFGYVIHSEQGSLGETWSEQAIFWQSCIGLILAFLGIGLGISVCLIEHHIFPLPVWRMFWTWFNSG